MRSKFAYMALAATFSFVAFANTASANLVYNGSFELNSGTYTTPTGWDFIPASYGSDTPKTLRISTVSPQKMAVGSSRLAQLAVKTITSARRSPTRQARPTS